MKDAQLIKAINDWDIKTVKKLLSRYDYSYRSINAHFKTTLTLIGKASAQSVDVKTDPLFHIAMSLIDHGADINARSESNTSFIKVCVEEYQIKFLKKFITNHLENIHKECFFKALGDAAEFIDSKLVLNMLDLGKQDYNYTELETLHLMTRKNCCDGIKWLLDYGCHVDMRDDSAYTPLMYAAECDLEESTAFLINHGANPFLVDDLGRTPIEIYKICKEYSAFGETKTLEIMENAIDNLMLQKSIKSDKMTQCISF